jgi:hypothetical protein
VGVLGEIGKFVKGAGQWREERRLCRGVPVRFFNFWRYTDPRLVWFARFVAARGLLARHPSRTIAFFSVFGSRVALWLDRSDVKVFFSGENIGPRFRNWRDHAEGEVELALGFEHLDRPDYLRLPLWVLQLPGEIDLDGLRRFFDGGEPQDRPEPRDRFCTLIAGYDPDGSRTAMATALSSIAPVDCAGRLLHNTDELVRAYGDDKGRFLRRYRFNLCPENADAPGYVSEKPFQAIASGCVPIYWGSGNDPEPEILNRDAMLFWEAGGGNGRLLERIAELERDPRRFAEFAAQPRFHPGAAERVWGWLRELEARLERALGRR